MASPLMTPVSAVTSNSDCFVNEQPKNPLHGITLQTIVEELVAHYGFERLSELVKIRAFTHDPSVKSALTFLRRTPWARAEVEQLYLRTLRQLKKTRANQ